MPRKTRSDSIKAAVAAATNARQALPEPPQHMPMSEAELVYFRSIVASRARDEWSESAVILAVRLSRLQATIEVESTKLAEEGLIVDSKPNPRSGIVDVLLRQEMALSRGLRLVGGVLGRSATIQNNRELEKNLAPVGFSDPWGLLPC
jgi:hypothetical protein